MHACVQVSLCVHLSVCGGGGGDCMHMGRGGVQSVFVSAGKGGGGVLPVSVNTKEHVTQPNMSQSKRCKSTITKRKEGIPKRKVSMMKRRMKRKMRRMQMVRTMKREEEGEHDEEEQEELKYSKTQTQKR